MIKFFYPRLAGQSMVKNRRFYVPYLMACAFTAAMFYDLCFLAGHPGLKNMKGSASIAFVLMLGVIVVGFFSGIFLFYTNSFLIKNRKKELGLYNILGMEKKNIAHLLLWESFFSAIAGIGVGLMVGIALSKLLLMLLLRLLRFEIPLGFQVSAFGVSVTAILFGGIFLVNLLHNLLSIQLSHPMELLKGSNAGEREPRTRWPIAMLGLLTLGGGYALALSIDSPALAVGVFFIAVILVIIGTYCLFISGSIALLKTLRRNKNYYYRANHFISVSGMLYRMKQNAAGLASICILCTMVLVTLSTTVCLYSGEEEVLNHRYPKDVSFLLSVENGAPAPVDAVEAIQKTAAQYGFQIVDPVTYAYISFQADIQGNVLGQRGLSQYSGIDSCLVYAITSAEYARITGETVSLEKNHVLAYGMNGIGGWDSLSLCGQKFEIDAWIDAFPYTSVSASHMTGSLYLILPGEPDFETIRAMPRLEDDGDLGCLRWYYGFDLSGEMSHVLECVDAMRTAISNTSLSHWTSDCRQDGENLFYSLYGGLFFIGLFLGAIFLMATVLIIYYKQISEGYDDKARYEIMQKVGMSKAEVRSSIRSQVLSVFFLPLIVSMVHLAFAFKMITKILVIFCLTNIGLFALCCGLTILIFAAGYTAIYLVTARTYYKIVSPNP